MEGVSLPKSQILGVLLPNDQNSGEVDANYPLFKYLNFLDIRIYLNNKPYES